MSDPEVPRSEQQDGVDDAVDSAEAGLAEAAAAAGDAPGLAADAAAETPIDPDIAAFEEAERAHPGTFTRAEETTAESAASDEDAPSWPAAPAPGFGVPSAEESAASDAPSFPAPPLNVPEFAAPEPQAPASEDSVPDAGLPVETVAVSAIPEESALPEADAAPSVATTAYAPPAADDAETQIVAASEPVAAPAQPVQPIFVQAPEPPRDRGNRGTAGAIGLLATLVFALLFLGTTLGLGALGGEVTAKNIADSALAPLTTWSFWLPVAAFFIGFWLLGTIINRGRWGLWVIFGIIVGAISYGGFLLGQLFEAPFWNITASEANDLVGTQLLAPLAIAAFIFGRELTIWFGAWVAHSGAKKTAANAEAQREYERTIEAGPSLPRS